MLAPSPPAIIVAGRPVSGKEATAMGYQTVGEPGPVGKLAEVFSGELMLPGDPSFDQARRV
jgi:hypothetical protein